MSIREVNQRAATILLWGTLLAINTFPFWVRPNSSADAVFIALAAIHAEICLICAWWLCYDGAGRFQRWLWSGLGLFAASLAGTALLAGRLVSLGAWRESTTIGLLAVVPAACVCLGIFLSSKMFHGLRLTTVSPTLSPGGQMRLSQLCMFVAACGYLSLLIRQSVISPRAGWLLEGGAHAYLLAGTQSVIVGLLAAPSALVVLKPNRFSPLWLVYFVSVCAVEPLAEWIIAAKLRIGGNKPSLTWPESYTSVVIDNLTWYGPQLIPTVVLFVLLRWSGVRVAEKNSLSSICADCSPKPTKTTNQTV